MRKLTAPSLASIRHYSAGYVYTDRLLTLCELALAGLVDLGDLIDLRSEPRRVRYAGDSSGAPRFPFGAALTDAGWAYLAELDR